MRQIPHKFFRFSKAAVACCLSYDRLLVLGDFPDMMPWLILICIFEIGDLKQQYSELDLRAGWPLIYGTEWFWNFLCFIFGWSGIGLFLAAVYFYQHLTFLRLLQHASYALISLLLITFFDLT